MEWEMMRGTADGQEPGTEGGRNPTGGPGSYPSAAARGPGDGQGAAWTRPVAARPRQPRSRRTARFAGSGFGR